MSVSQDNIKIARFVAEAIGFKPKVNAYWDEKEENSLDILEVIDPIDQNVKFYCTLGLSDFENNIDFNDGTRNIPIEILMSGNEIYEKIPNILSTCGFYLAKNKWNCQPNTVFKDQIRMYYENTDMEHILFTAPFLWSDKLAPLELEHKTVNWLFAVPISDKELIYKEQLGTEALLDLLEQKGIDIFDLKRKSVF